MKNQRLEEFVKKKFKLHYTLQGFLMQYSKQTNRQTGTRVDSLPPSL
jgi:hypothetical protein